MAEKKFAFGKNWEHFIKVYLNEERIEEAKKSLLEFWGDYDIKGKSFLDIGCGSGVFSLAAIRLGASEVVSFDVDPDSVKSCQYLREKEGNPKNWTVKQGSILDEKFMSKMDKYDFVYSWGVLHHTGQMWKAIENTTKVVKDGGLLYIAIYNKADFIGIYDDLRIGTSGFWVKAKRFYISLPHVVQDMIDYTVMAALFVTSIFRLKNPFKEMKSTDYRGMSWRIIIKDWLGGYPYEYAAVDEIFNFVKKFGFSLENLKFNDGLRNNDYLFKKTRVINRK
jgi:2-polyprenyl-6-hydroxyphenyl methylase/3-demethylubiquinone-9 3-methyltransferase